MAGIDLTGADRSQLLQQLLGQNQQRPQIRSGVELAARLGAQAIRQNKIKKLRKKAEKSEDALLKALQGSLPTNERTLEGFDNVPSEKINIPGKRVGVDSAVSQLPVEQQIQALQVQAGRKQLAIPAPVKDTRVNLEKEFEFAKSQGFKGGISDFILLKKPRGTSVTNILPAGANKGTEKLFEGIGERADERIGQAVASSQEDASLDRVSLALSRGAQTGFGESVLLDLKSAANTVFGTEFSEADSEGEVVRAIGNQLALRMRNPTSGLGLTGSTSNKDLVFLKDSVTNLQKTEQGNIALIENQKRLNKLKRDLVAEQQRIISANENIVPIDLDTKLIKFTNEYQLFTPQEKAEIKAIAEQGKKGKSVVDRVNSALNKDTRSDDDVLNDLLQ